MNSIFKRKRTPEQLVKLLTDALVAPKSVAEAKGTQPTVDEITKRLGQIKLMLYGEAEQESNVQKCEQLAGLLLKEGLLLKLLEGLTNLPFEAKKHVAQIFNNLVRRNLAGVVGHIERKPQIMSTLVRGYESSEIALNCGAMLRECLRHEGLAKILMYSDDLWRFFDCYVHLPNFDMASDAFVSFKEVFTRHKTLVAEFLNEKFGEVFSRYNLLLESQNYVTRRQSLKLLGEILLDRANFCIMMRYISIEGDQTIISEWPSSIKENLKMMMNLLRDRSGNIQFEAFHVFKVFVANPKKPEEITQILLNNKDKLIAYLKSFHNNNEDEQFNEEKALLINTLSKLASDAEHSQASTAAPAQGEGR